ncbi:hypothetical protein [Acidisoma sp. S159]|uniref:hypothetical protein n=1 Tax=Acidisoma sp. S159 TaxID=1747225 RepID=UPI00131A9C25|nr:hypothetical protein [Acidisoma sp. S159]
MNAFDLLGRINSTDVVVIQRVGPLDLLATAVAKISGARHVVAIGAPDSRLEMAEEFGADKRCLSNGFRTKVEWRLFRLAGRAAAGRLVRTQVEGRARQRGRQITWEQVNA